MPDDPFRTMPPVGTTRRNGDPYSPHRPAAPRHDSVLPERRLARLGTTETAMAVYRDAWNEADSEGRARMLASLAVLTDRGLADQAAGVDRLEGTGVNATMVWVRGQPDRPLAALLCLAAENRRPEPRQSLLDKLSAVLGNPGGNGEETGSE